MFLDRYTYRVMVLCSFVLFSSESLKAQSEYIKVDTLVDSLSLDMDEVVLVGRAEETASSYIHPLEVIHVDEVIGHNPQFTTDLLEQLSDVYIQKSQIGGGSPIIRGMEANRILLVVDGVRMNNAIYRSGHIHNSNTIDPFILENVEVHQGAGSLRYGSDAMGGVIHYITKSPVIGSTLTNFRSSYNSANHGFDLHADVNVGGKQLASMTSISLGRYGDLRSGKRYDHLYDDFGQRKYYVDSDGIKDTVMMNENPFVQIGTAYDRIDLMQKMKYLYNDDTSLELNLQYSTSSDIPRYDRLTENRADDLPKYAEWYYGPQQRLLTSAKLKSWHKSIIYDRIVATISYQNLDEDRYNRLLYDDLLSAQIVDVDVYNINLDAHKKIFTTGQLIYGIDAQYNDVNSSAYFQNIISDVRTENANTRYPSEDARMLNMSSYATLKNHIGLLQYDIGLRAGWSKTSIRYGENNDIEWPKSYIDGITSIQKAAVGSCYVQYPFKSLILTGGYAQAYRAPNIDDIAKFRVKGGEITIPNVNLQPERTQQWDINAKYDGKILNASVGLYHNRIKNIILRKPTLLPDESSYLSYRGDSLMTVSNINADSGEISGWNVDIGIRIIEQLSVQTSMAQTIGADNNGDPLSHIPPVYGRSEISWISGNFKVRLSNRFNAFKTIFQYGGSEDNMDQATPAGTPLWEVYDFGIQYRWDKVQLSFALNNITDQHFRPFSSGVSAPGRHVVFSVTMK